jgi:putative Mn2+ efflux pump MntP
MSIVEILLVGIGLSMDAFAVAICKGLGMEKVRARDAGLIAVYFGVFQGLMPLLGWFLGSQFARYVTRWAPWISFVLLAYIGANMIRESREKDKEEKPGLRHRDLLVLAIATSIDALAVGVTFSVLELAVSIWWAAMMIAVTTFAISLAGVYIGNVFGARYKSRAELTGGIILIGIGLKILLQHLGVL